MKYIRSSILNIRGRSEGWHWTAWQMADPLQLYLCCRFGNWTFLTGRSLLQPQNCRTRRIWLGVPYKPTSRVWVTGSDHFSMDMKTLRSGKFWFDLKKFVPSIWICILSDLFFLEGQINLNSIRLEKTWNPK
jgi:hypothetical protein